MGNKVYWIVAGTILTYIMIVALFFNKILGYLFSGRYVLFVCCIILCALIFTTIPNIVFASYIDNYDLFSEIVVIDNISAFVIFILCISGVIVPVFIRSWMMSNQYLNQLKVKEKSSQVEQLKEQINPASFFKILNKSRHSVKSEPDKASSMLMKLGQLLRYQLYDCNRTQVLLTAEISFLQNFLELEKLCSSKFNYTITSEGDMNGIFMSPSILLPYVQSVVGIINNDEEPQIIDIHVDNFDEAINVTLRISEMNSNILLKKELLKVRERLNTLYKNRYKLTISNDQQAEKTIVSLKLDKE
jgi:LytS/YehU family sensor histidine kinase